MDDQRPLFIPVILGTPRRGRLSGAAAALMVRETGRMSGVETELIDIAAVPMPVDDAGESIKDPRFAGSIARADGLVIVSPEYNHGYPGLLKHVLDSCLKEYIHKPAGIVGVSAGPFGGTRVIQNLLPVMRELGLVTTFWDVNFSSVQDAFDESGGLRDNAFLRRIDKFLRELIWMARTLRYGREQVAVGSVSAPAPIARMPCPGCGAVMNPHAEKPIVPPLATDAGAVDWVAGGIVEEVHQCPACGRVESRRV